MKRHLFHLLAVLLCTCLANASPLRLKDVPSMAQNIRPFDTISFEYVQEESFGGQTWERLARNKLKWDRKKNRFLFTSITPYSSDESLMEVRTVSFIDGKLRTYFFHQKRTKDLSQSPNAPQNPVALIRNTDTTIFDYDSSLAFFLYGNSHSAFIWEFFSDKKFLDSIEVKKMPQKGCFELYHEDSDVYVFDAKIGFFTKRIMRDYYEDGREEDYWTIEANDIIRKNGWLFPSVIRSYLSPKMGDGRVTRRLIDKSSLEFNQKMSPNDFLIEVPEGCKVYDMTNNRDYTTSVKTKLQDVTEMEQQLLQLIEKSKGIK